MEKLHKKLAQKPIEGAHLIGEEVNPPTFIAVSCESTYEHPKNLEYYFESDRIGGNLCLLLKIKLGTLSTQY